MGVENYGYVDIWELCSIKNINCGKKSEFFCLCKLNSNSVTNWFQATALKTNIAENNFKLLNFYQDHTA